MQRFFIDARKLGDGGIGTFIETLLDGAIEFNARYPQKCAFDIVVSSSFLRKKALPEAWSKYPEFSFHEDDTQKYSLSEYLLFPRRFSNLISKADVYVSPHYTLPFGIKTRTLVTIHDVIQLQYPEKFLHYIIPRRLIASALKRADIVTTVSPHSRRTISSMFSFPEDKIKIIPNAVRRIFTESDYKSENKKLTFLYVGADRFHKQVIVFLESMKEMLSAGVECAAHVVSELSASHVAMIEHSILKDNVTVHNGISNTELVQLYREATFFVCTSLDEGFCIPILDAMYAGVPVLCPDAAYARELTEGNALFYVPGSSADLYYKITKAIYSNETLQDMKDAASARARMFSSLSQFERFIACV